MIGAGIQDKIEAVAVTLKQPSLMRALPQGSHNHEPKAAPPEINNNISKGNLKLLRFGALAG